MKICLKSSGILNTAYWVMGRNCKKILKNFDTGNDYFSLCILRFAAQLTLHLDYVGNIGTKWERIGHGLGV